MFLCLVLRTIEKRKHCESRNQYTLFLTEHSFHHALKFAVNEGDVICRLWQGFTSLILRRTEDDQWILGGHCRPEQSTIEQEGRVARKSAKAKIEVFRLK